MRVLHHAWAIFLSTESVYPRLVLYVNFMFLVQSGLGLGALVRGCEGMKKVQTYGRSYCEAGIC